MRLLTLRKREFNGVLDAAPHWTGCSGKSGQGTRVGLTLAMSRVVASAFQRRSSPIPALLSAAAKTSWAHPGNGSGPSPALMQPNWSMAGYRAMR